MLYHSVEQMIGSTPLVALEKIEKKHGLAGNIFAKLERSNPGGSAKDRIALEMILEGERTGALKPGGTLIEPTSGNTGVGIAMIAAARGYRAIIVMPETMSIERRLLMSAYGAEVVLTEGSKGMAGAVDKANELAKEIEGALVAGQFENSANPQAHYKTTGPEIWADMAGDVDILVAGVGTGGTLTGTTRYLREQNPNLKAVAVEPLSSPLLSQGKAGPHAIAGIGANFVPAVLDTEIYDEIVTVSNEDAMEFGREIAKVEGLLVGISSGAALAAACQIAKRAENVGKKIVVVLPDTGERYLSTVLFKAES